MGSSACRATNGTENICREGYTGPECAVCSIGYFFSWTSHECKMCAASNDAEVTITIAMPIVFGTLCLILMATFVYRGFPSQQKYTAEGDGGQQPPSETAPDAGQSGANGDGSSATFNLSSNVSKEDDASEINLQSQKVGEDCGAESSEEQRVKDPPPKKQLSERAELASKIEAPTSTSTALETAGNGQQVAGGSVVALLKLLLNLVQVLNAIAPTYGTSSH